MRLDARCNPQEVGIQDPDALCCPLTLEPFEDPVITMHGSTYERDAIEEWFNLGHSIDPLTEKQLDSLILIPNHHIKKICDQWREGTLSVSELPYEASVTEEYEAKEDLIAAAKVGDAPRVRELLKAGADPTALNADGMSALHMAALNGHEVIVQLLLEAGAPPDLALVPGKETPLFLAARYGRTRIVEILADKGANINATRRCGFITALDETSLRGHVLTAMELVKREAVRIIPGISLADRLNHVARCLDQDNPDAAEHVLRSLELGGNAADELQYDPEVAAHFLELWNKTTEARVSQIKSWPEPILESEKAKRMIVQTESVDITPEEEYVEIEARKQQERKPYVVPIERIGRKAKAPSKAQSQEQQQFRNPKKRRGSVCIVRRKSLAELFEVEPTNTSSEAPRAQAQRQQQWGYFQQINERNRKEKELKEALQIPFPTKTNREMPMQSFVIMGSC